MQSKRANFEQLNNKFACKANLFSLEGAKERKRANEQENCLFLSYLTLVAAAASLASIMKIMTIMIFEVNFVV